MKKSKKALLAALMLSCFPFLAIGDASAGKVKRSRSYPLLVFEHYEPRALSRRRSYSCIDLTLFARGVYDSQISTNTNLVRPGIYIDLRHLPVRRSSSYHCIPIVLPVPLGAFFANSASCPDLGNLKSLLEDAPASPEAGVSDKSQSLSRSSSMPVLSPLQNSLNNSRSLSRNFSDVEAPQDVDDTNNGLKYADSDFSSSSFGETNVGRLLDQLDVRIGTDNENQAKEKEAYNQYLASISERQKAYDAWFNSCRTLLQNGDHPGGDLSDGQIPLCHNFGTTAFEIDLNSGSENGKNLAHPGLTADPSSLGSEESGECDFDLPCINNIQPPPNRENFGKEKRVNFDLKKVSTHTSVPSPLKSILKVPTNDCQKGSSAGAPTSPRDYMEQTLEFMRELEARNQRSTRSAVTVDDDIITQKNSSDSDEDSIIFDSSEIVPTESKLLTNSPLSDEGEEYFEGLSRQYQQFLGEKKNSANEVSFAKHDDVSKTPSSNNSHVSGSTVSTTSTKHRRSHSVIEQDWDKK